MFLNFVYVFISNSYANLKKKWTWENYLGIYDCITFRKSSIWFKDSISYIIILHTSADYTFLSGQNIVHFAIKGTYL